MVLEQIFKEKWIEKKPMHAFLIGVIYSIIGILSASIIFGSNPGLMSVAFTSILCVLSLNKLLGHEENVEIREKKLSLKLLLKDHKDIFEIYFFLFMGIFLVYALISLFFDNSFVTRLFSPQLVTANIHGNAIQFGFPDFLRILKNNIVVLVVCLILSIVYGAGSILFITWNASVWGVVFGYIARQAAEGSPWGLFSSFLVLMLPILPHMITEAVSYFSAAIVGGVVSKAVIREKPFSKKFEHIMTDAMILLLLGFILVVFAAFLEVYMFPLLAFK